ncbi:MAG: hypothetical protein ACI9PP_000657 [Halobacteriales archaeon]|jgi:hypothetical protein
MGPRPRHERPDGSVSCFVRQPSATGDRMPDEASSLEMQLSNLDFHAGASIPVHGRFVT